MLRDFPQEILNTIIYADIFDYPLTREEIGKWMIKVKSQSGGCRTKFKSIIDNSKVIKKKNDLYYLDGRDKIVDLRKKREKYSEEKLKIAKNITSLIKCIPTVKLVGLTGNLAINNADRDDDIDLLIITKKGYLWTTRLLVTLLVEVIGRRRRPNDTDVTDKICLNMFVSEDYLSVPVNERDLFSAHEVTQMKPLFDRDDTYQRFLTENAWVNNYLPNAVDKDMRILGYDDIKNKYHSVINSSIVKLLNYIERALGKIQLCYMKKRMTKEIISKGVIRFHPKDTREWILKEYKKRSDFYHKT